MVAVPMLLVLFLLPSPEPVSHQGSAAVDKTSACAMVQQALADFARIKPGTTRREIEKYFDYDGGLQWSDKAVFTYRQCRYVKVEVEFKAAPSRGSAFKSPDDTVKSTSKLFIDYPTMD
jgi:hypothetical protein